MSDNRHFYRDLVPLPSFETAVDPALHIDVPDDWWIVIADVSDSTEAIAWGAYKNVNTVGVACIAAMVNIDRRIELPYLFGGDGATFAIPEALCEPAVVALRGTQRMAITQFGLHLRAGLVESYAGRPPRPDGNLGFIGQKPNALVAIYPARESKSFGLSG
jgi:hypothetical protein